MTEHSTFVDAPPEDVFATLSDPGAYGEWVVGAERVWSADDHWPQVGATFEHTQGRWPLRLRDTTSVLECRPGERLVLEARARPLLVARVEIELRPEEAGTRVVIRETATGGPARRLRPVVDRLVWLRNVETLRRLSTIVERRRGATASAPPEGVPSPS